MQTYHLLFFFTNLVIGTPLSLNQLDNSDQISRQADTYTFRGIDSQADSSSPNNYNDKNQELAFSPNFFNNNEGPKLAPPNPPDNPEEIPFYCSPQAGSAIAPGGQPQLRQACCKKKGEEASMVQIGCHWYGSTDAVCADEKHWRCCLDILNGGTGCTTTVIKETPPADRLVPEVVPETPAWQNYIKQSFVTGSGDVWER